MAAIAVDDRGENQIIVVPGANGQVNDADVERLKAGLPNATALLLQCEIPLPAIQAAACAAQAANVPVILDPAPAPERFPIDLYASLDIITPNETEASQLVGFAVSDPETAAQAARRLQQRGVRIAIVKLGSQGAFCAAENEAFWVSAFPVQAVDPVAAGDAFNGGLAVALAKGLSLPQAVRWGAAAGALAVTKAGAQPALPDWNAFEVFLRSQGIAAG